MKPYADMIEEYPDTAIVFGDAAMPQFETLLVLSEPHTALFFMGGAASAEKSGAWPAAMKALASLDINAPRHCGIPPEPDIECVEAMVESLEREKPDMVVAIGGGSVMDAAKAAYASWQAKTHVSELFGAGKVSAKLAGQQFKRIVCLPTTAGTGSEATPYANIVDRKRDVKMLIADAATIPEFSFVDPEFTVSAPKELTLSVGLDALAHSVEGFLNFKAKDPHPDADAWALESIRLIVAGLPEALESPSSLAARAKLSAAATLGGMVIRNKPTGLPHLCSYSFFDKAPHGTVVASLLPHFWRFYLEEPAVKERTMALKGIFPGEGQSSPEAVVEAFASFIASCGAPKSLSGLEGCDEALIAKIAKAAKENPVKLETAPRPVGVKDSEKVIGDILRKAWKA